MNKLSSNQIKHSEYDLFISQTKNQLFLGEPFADTQFHEKIKKIEKMQVCFGFCFFLFAFCHFFFFTFLRSY